MSAHDYDDPARLRREIRSLTRRMKTPGISLDSLNLLAKDKAQYERRLKDRIGKTGRHAHSQEAIISLLKDLKSIITQVDQLESQDLTEHFNTMDDRNNRWYAFSCQAPGRRSTLTSFDKTAFLPTNFSLDFWPKMYDFQVDLKHSDTQKQWEYMKPKLLGYLKRLYRIWQKRLTPDSAG